MTILCDHCPSLFKDCSAVCCCREFQKKTMEEIEMEKRRWRKWEKGSIWDDFIVIVLLLIALSVAGKVVYDEFTLFRILSGH